MIPKLDSLCVCLRLSVYAVIRHREREGEKNAFKDTNFRSKGML